METLNELHKKLMRYTRRKSFDIEIDYIGSDDIESKILSIDKLSYGHGHIRVHRGNTPIHVGHWLYRTYLDIVVNGKSTNTYITVNGKSTNTYSSVSVYQRAKLLITGDSIDTYLESVRCVVQQLESKSDLRQQLIDQVKLNLPEYKYRHMVFELAGELLNMDEKVDL